jgi:hypothetical protein
MIQLLPCRDGSYPPLGGGDATADDLLGKGATRISPGPLDRSATADSRERRD